MSDSSAEESWFKWGLLGTAVSGLGLYAYSQFFRKRSYLIEWRASVKSDAVDADTDADTNSAAAPVWTLGSSTFTDWPFKTHRDVVDRVFEIVRAHPNFESVAPENITVEIPHIHVL